MLYNFSRISSQARLTSVRFIIGFQPFDLSFSPIYVPEVINILAFSALLDNLFQAYSSPTESFATHIIDWLIEYTLTSLKSSKNYPRLQLILVLTLYTSIFIHWCNIVPCVYSVALWKITVRFMEKNNMLMYFLIQLCLDIAVIPLGLVCRIWDKNQL